MLLLTVSEINSHLRTLFAADPILVDVWVQGEISNFKRATSGHCYFTLKDDRAALDAVMWKGNANRQSALPTNGDAVLAHGHVSLYETSGRLQLYVDMFQPAGVGLLHARFVELQARLEAEGLFDERHKRPLPPLPRRIGVATSASGAALQDILHVLQRRLPLVEVLVSPCLVQGDEAPASIVQALGALYAAPVDLIILARGGGSIEDLWAFNDEAVARAVFARPVPLITGVGHETDTTIVDYVADLRAPTPSAAAEGAVPDGAALRQGLAALRQQLDEVAAAQVAAQRQTLADQAERLRRHHPAATIGHMRQQADDLLRRAGARAGALLERQRLHLNGLDARLAALSPAATLQRGYALVRRAAAGPEGAQGDSQEHGQAVVRCHEVQPGDRLTLTLQDGHLVVRVEGVEVEGVEAAAAPITDHTSDRTAAGEGERL